MASLSLLFSRPNISQESSKVPSSSSNSNSQQIWRENQSNPNNINDNLSSNQINNTSHTLRTNVNENVLKQGGVRAIQASQIINGIPPPPNNNNNTSVSVRQPSTSANQVPTGRAGEILGGEREVLIERVYDQFPSTYGRSAHPLSFPMATTSVISPYTSNYTSSSSSSSSSSSFATSPTSASLRKHHPLHRYQVQSSVEALNHQSCMALQHDDQSTLEYDNQSTIRFLPETFLPWAYMEDCKNGSAAAADFDVVTTANNVGFPHYDDKIEIGNLIGKEVISNQLNSYQGALMNSNINNNNNINCNNNDNNINSNNNNSNDTDINSNNNNNNNNNNNMYNNSALISKSLPRIVGSRNVPPHQRMFPAHDIQIDQGYNILNKIHPQHLSNKFMTDDIRNGNNNFRASIDSIGSKDFDIYGLSQNHSLSDLPGIVGLGSRSLGSGMGGLGSMSCLGIGSDVDGIEETFRNDMINSLRREELIDKNFGITTVTANHVVGTGVGRNMAFSSNPSNVYDNRFDVVTGRVGVQVQGPGRNERISTESRVVGKCDEDDRIREDIEIIKSELLRETIGMSDVCNSSVLTHDRNIISSMKHVTVENIFDVDTDVDVDVDAVVNGGCSDSITSSIAAYWHSETLPLSDVDTAFHPPFLNPDLAILSQPPPLSGLEVRTEHAVHTRTLDHVQCQVRTHMNVSDITFSHLCNDDVIDSGIDIAMSSIEDAKGGGGGREKKLRGESMDLGFDDFMGEYGNIQNSEVRLQIFLFFLLHFIFNFISFHSIFAFFNFAFIFILFYFFLGLILFLLYFYFFFIL